MLPRRRRRRRRWHRRIKLRLRKSADVINHLPAFFFTQSFLKARHGPVPDGNFPKKLAVRHNLHHFHIREISGLGCISPRLASLPVAGIAMATRASFCVNRFPRSNRSLNNWNGIRSGNSFRRRFPISAGNRKHNCDDDAHSDHYDHDQARRRSRTRGQIKLSR